MNPELIKFVTEHTHLKVEHLKPELRLAEDIGFYGLDAIAFFEAFFLHFNIQHQENFDAARYIDGGPDFAPRPVAWLKQVFSKEQRKYLRPDVTLAHLDRVIEKGSWFNEA